MKRRKFIENITKTSLGLALTKTLVSCKKSENNTTKPTEVPLITSQKNTPMVIATWDVKGSITQAWEYLTNGKSALDAVEAGVKVEEANEKGQSVGIGGLPDREGNVTLDACIMDEKGNCGSVVYLQNIKHAVSVARMVMEKTPHVMLAGNGAKQFALKNGFRAENLLTDASKKAWKKWKEKSEYKPIINIENHDTIGMLTLDKNGNLSGACTTSGLAYKMAGRVGDSPIIGAGLYVDNEIGAATATGLGETVIKAVGSFLVVELMRQGMSPQEACEAAVKRVISKSPNFKDFQVGFIALNKKGQTGAYCIHENFVYTTQSSKGSAVTKSDYFYKKP